MKAGYELRILTANGGPELEILVNEFVKSGIASDIEDIQYYLNIAYITFKRKEGIAVMNVYKYVTHNGMVGIVLAASASEAEGALASHSIRGASITPLNGTVTTESTPRIL